MKNLAWLLLYALITLFCHTRALSQVAVYGERGSDLGIKVFQQVVRSKPLDNVVLSPHGVASVLGMLLPGGHGETRRQILSALRYKKNGPYRMLKKLHKTLTAKSNQDAILIANGMFSPKGFPMQKSFVDINKANFQAESRSVDFSDTQKAADKINAWISNKTRGHITSLIKATMLDSALSRLVVVNAIYFKGLWKYRFQPENTKLRPFTGGDGQVFKVPMMSQLSVFNIGVASTPQQVAYKVIELPYHGNKTSMLIVLPTEEDVPLSHIIPHINTATVQSWGKLMHMRKVHLLLPRFTADLEVDLKAPLSVLGMTDMFRLDKADFRHLSSEPVYISKALQKTKIVVNEDGTKASAATAAILMARSSPPWVSVDRPFLFLIRHNPTGTLLFMGQINQP
ncbi:glia-derived nexin [Hippocampus comes]|uniref:Serpin peptidase inhibitor, clade E (nexin, plasminogen activator inhibitor type 1), member 2 n=1 Tax=Hippocampus comes TaxID=109280 RepID=A0A3Q3DII3_HIPCM|nr:PREDICTED: glia-derived nexin [Hippocampus comes]